MKRVVVTGLGMVTPLACGVETTWRRLLAGENGAARVESFDVSDIPCQIAAQVPELFEALSGMKMSDLLGKIRTIGDKADHPDRLPPPDGNEKAK